MICFCFFRKIAIKLVLANTYGKEGLLRLSAVSSLNYLKLLSKYHITDKSYSVYFSIV